MRPFEEELHSLTETLQEMGALVAHAVQRSVLSLVEKNEDYAHQVIRDESRVDQMEIQIDEKAGVFRARGRRCGSAGLRRLRREPAA